MPIPACGFSIQEFCEEHGFSPAQYKTWQKRGVGPQETLFPGTRVRRIMPESYEVWLKRIAHPDIQMAEAQRRTAFAKRIGKLSLSNPNHPSNLMRAIRKSA